MDRYEMTIRIEQLNKLVGKGDYISAAKVADQLDWRKMKNWTVMSNAIDAYVAVEKYDKARNVCIYAYNRKLGGRRLLATLMEMYVKLGEFDDASEIYHEYVEAAPRDLNRYTLLYKLKRAQGAPVGELIDILQEYKENELDEAYEYELALLYSEAGLVDRCVRECDEMVLWFAEGVYVEKALRLKQMYSPLTPGQAKKLAYLERMSAMGMNDSVPEAVQEEESQAEEIPAGPVFTDGFENEEPAEEAETEAVFESPQEAPVMGAQEARYVDELGNTTEWSLTGAQEEELESPEDWAAEFGEDGGIPAEEEQNTQREDSPVQEKSAPKQEEDFEITINVPDYSVYDTRNVQQELKANVEEILQAAKRREEQDALLEEQEKKREAKAKQQELKAAKKAEEEQPKAVEQPSPGGTLADVPVAEDILYADYSGSEPTKEIIINTRQWRKASRNNARKAQKVPTQETTVLPKLDPAQKDNAAADDARSKQSEAGTEASKQAADQAAAALAGRLTVEQMAAIVAQMQAQQEQQAREDDQIEGQMDISQWLQELEEEEPKEIEAAQTEAAVTEEDTVPSESGAWQTETVATREDSEPEEEDAAGETQEEFDFEELPDTEETEGPWEEAPEQTYIVTEAEEDDFEESDGEELPDLEAAISAGIEKIIDETVSNAVAESRVQGTAGNYVLQPEERKFLEKYLYMTGMERRLCKYVGGRRTSKGDGTSNTGNAVVMGNRTTDKTAFAVNLYKALHAFDENRAQKLAKITAESLNSKGFTSVEERLKGQTLIIENAGHLNREQVSKILRFMDSQTEGTLFILEDEEFNINKLFAENPDFAERFTGRFLLKHYTVNELVELAKDYADEQGWKIEDKALLKLYLILSKLPNDDQGNIVGVVKDIMEYAGENARTRFGNKLFGRFRSALLIKDVDFELPKEEPDDEEDGEEE